MAQSMLEASPDNPDLVKDVFRRILIRTPKEKELLTLNAYYHDALELYKKDSTDAEKLVAVGEFKQRTTDPAKTAALMLTAQVIYNLDETITKE